MGETGQSDPQVEELVDHLWDIVKRYIPPTMHPYERLNVKPEIRGLVWPALRPNRKDERRG